MGVCNCSMFCCTSLYVPSSFAIILMEKRELVALLSLSSWCLPIVVWLFFVVPLVCLQFVIVVFLDHTHLLFLLGGIFHFYSNSYRTFFKQTEETLIRCHILLYLIWVCTVCLCPILISCMLVNMLGIFY